jgi:hypothetical protein
VVPTPTLHAYANLIQIAALVLNKDQAVIKDVPEHSFSLSLDRGRRFQPSHVRVEGDDPISLAIVMDVSGEEDSLLMWIDGALAQLAERSLRPGDRVALYAVNCTWKRSEVGMPVSADGIRADVRRLLQEAGRDRGTECGAKPHLWDALEEATRALSDSPARRVILAVTDGRDAGSERRWHQAQMYAQFRGVAIFGLTDGYLYQKRPREDPYQSICWANGGAILTTRPEDLNKDMQRFMEMVRGRYIIDFPRASNATGGLHSLDVKIAHVRAVIRFAAGPYRVAAKQERQDPSMVPGSGVPKPEQGGRRKLPGGTASPG